jgi:hypothetical protein
MVKWLVWSLIFPVVKSNTSAWTKDFDKKGILVSILSVNQKLESVKEENDASKSQVGRQKISDSIIVSSVHVEAWVAPDHEDSQLEENNVSIISLVEGDLSRSSDSPCQKWVRKHAVNEESRKIPQPGQLGSNSWQGFHLECPVILFNILSIWLAEVLV